jgi:hypothetical protein
LDGCRGRQAAARVSGRVQGGGNLRWLMVVFMAFLGTTINYVDRANLGVAVPFIQKELHSGPAGSRDRGASL